MAVIFTFQQAVAALTIKKSVCKKRAAKIALGRFTVL